MEQNFIQRYLTCLQKEVAPAMGCTEPAAVALAVAHAVHTLGCEPDSIQVQVSHYIYKNGKNVGIPGTNMNGLSIAAALGAVNASPEKELLVLEGITQSQKQKALTIYKAGKVEISVPQNVDNIYIQATVSHKKDQASATISGTHKHLIQLKKNNITVYKAEPVISVQSNSKNESCDLSVAGVWQFATTVPVQELAFLKDAIELNQAMAQKGLAGQYGLNVGKSLLQKNATPLASNTVSERAVAITAAAADARMAGLEFPVMSVAGSGNQGLTATLPVVTIGQELQIEEERILRALAISILITVHTKKHIGRLSVLCGCSISAAIGSCGAIVYLLGGSQEQMKQGIRTMIADITGVICDGAKPGCALKIATATSAAIRAANMALQGMGADETEGIVKKDIEESLANMGTIGKQGMEPANLLILNMI